MYQQGLGCEKSLEKALHYYELASGQNQHAASLMKAVQAKARSAPGSDMISH
jgi:TPR repeat protein